jgi:hypothetical protein
MGEVKQKIGIGLLIAVVLAIIYALYNYFRNKSVNTNLSTLSTDAKYQNEFNSRKLDFATTARHFDTTTGLVLSFDDATPTNTKSVVPVYPLTKLDNYRSDAPNWISAKRAKNKARIKQLWTKWEKDITQASKDNRIPRHILLTIMAIEHKDSGSLDAAEKFNEGIYKGLTQISISQTQDSLTRYKKLGWITKSQLAFFEDKGLLSGQKLKIGSSDLLTADVNINACAITLSGLAFKYGFINLHRWIFSYNRGENRLTNDGKQNLSIDETINYYMKTSNYIGAEYLLKAFGKDGAADIICNDLGIID